MKAIKRTGAIRASATAIRILDRNLQQMVKAMIDEVEGIIERAYRERKAEQTQDASFFDTIMQKLDAAFAKFQSFFAADAVRIAQPWIDEVAKRNYQQMDAGLRKVGGFGIQAPEFTEGVKKAAQTSTAYNVSLIKSIPQEYSQKIKGAVMQSEQSGGVMSDLFDTIIEIGYSTKKRATLIATDQTHKANSAITQARFKDAGVKKWQWIHSAGGVHPRPMHVALDGQVFDVGDCPVSDPSGERALPGVLINCRCVQAAVFERDTAGEAGDTDIDDETA